MTELIVELYGTHVGSLRGSRDVFDFTAEPAGIERFGTNSTALSVAVPLLSRQGRSDLHKRRTFFEELLAEGGVRSQLAQNARLDSDNTLALLARYGRDVAGAVQIWDPTDPHEPRTPEASPVDDSDIVRMFDEVRTNPLGNRGRRRLSSLAGVQDKVLLTRTDTGWAEPLDGYPSTHILKPQSGKYRSLIFDEEYGSRFPRRLGLSDFQTHVVAFEGRQALVIERYDRDAAGGRVHQEDFNQALGYRGDEKYEQSPGGGRLRAIAAVLREHASGTELTKLLQMVTLSAAIGNLDLHAKNISILHLPDGSVRLAPMYDVVPQLHLHLDEVLSLAVNGVYDFPRLTGNDLIAEGESWKLRDARSIVTETLEQVRVIADSETPLPGADASLAGVATHQSKTLLDSVAHPATSRANSSGSFDGKQQPAPEVFLPRSAPGGWGGPVG